MLTALIFILRMTICQVTKLFHRNQDLYLLYSPQLSLIVCCCFFCFAFKLSFGMFLKCFWQVGYAKFLSWCHTNLQSLNHEHTGKPILSVYKMVDIGVARKARGPALQLKCHR